MNTITSSILKTAIEEAEKSTYNRFHLGAVIFKGKRILSKGHNGIRSCSAIPNKHKNYINSLHAEQAALMNLDWNKVKGCDILIVKVSPTDKIISNAKPCSMCMKILNHVGIRNVYFSDEHGQIQKHLVNKE